MSLQKKLGMGVASMALGAALIGGGTFAYFNDTETSTGNTFAAGTINLQPDQISSNKLALKDLKPGSTFTYNLPLTNAGTLDADLWIDINKYDKSGGTDNADLGEVLHITEFKLGDTVLDFDADKDGTTTLKEFANAINTKIGSIEKNSAKTLKISGVFFESGNPQNQYQGAGLDLDIQFELRQQ